MADAHMGALVEFCGAAVAPAKAAHLLPDEAVAEGAAMRWTGNSLYNSLKPYCLTGGYRFLCDACPHVPRRVGRDPSAAATTGPTLDGPPARSVQRHAPAMTVWLLPGRS